MDNKQQHALSPAMIKAVTYLVSNYDSLEDMYDSMSCTMDEIRDSLDGINDIFEALKEYVTSFQYLFEGMDSSSADE